MVTCDSMGAGRPPGAPARDRSPHSACSRWAVGADPLARGPLRADGRANGGSGETASMDDKTGALSFRDPDPRGDVTTSVRILGELRFENAQAALTAREGVRFDPESALSPSEIRQSEERLAIAFHNSVPDSTWAPAVEIVRRLAARARAGHVDLALEAREGSRIHAGGREEPLAKNAAAYQALWDPSAPWLRGISEEEAAKWRAAGEVRRTFVGLANASDEVRALLVECLCTTARAQDLLVPGLGVFSLRKAEPYWVRNPETGEVRQKPSSWKVAILPLQLLDETREATPGALNFVDWLVRTTGAPRERLVETVSALVEPLRCATAASEPSTLDGVCSVKVRVKPAGQGRNPQSGAVFSRSSRTVVTAAAEPALLERIQQAD